LLRSLNFGDPTYFLGGDIGKGPCGKSKVLGIIGFGRIGKAVCRRAQGFDMQVLAYDPTAKEEIVKTPGVIFCELNDLLDQSDFVSLHCNLTERTHHLIGRDELKRMKKSAFLINTARGPIVNEEALVAALRKDEIAGAGLDVYENEPKVALGLNKLENVVLVPHIASASRETRAEMALMAARNALALLRRDQAPHTVNPEVYQTSVYQERMQRAG